MDDVAGVPVEDTSSPCWQPLSAIDRRVVGVLVEKSKTTPEAYPLSLNAVRSGCNQKSNRFPLMELEAEDVQESLDRLRPLGATAEVHGDGRVARYRHLLYEWLGVDKAELAVMAELLLRGAQTEGELRGRVARMQPLADLNDLRPILASLKQKGLVIPLTPEGRGHVVTHALYEPRELEKLRGQFGSAGARGLADDDAAAPRQTPVGTPGPAAHPAGEGSFAPATHLPFEPASQQLVEDLQRQMEEVRAEVASLRKDLDDLWANFR